MSMEKLLKRIKHSLYEARNEYQILDDKNNLVAKIRTSSHDMSITKPMAFLDRYYSTMRLKRALTKAGCSIEYIN